MKKIIVKLQAYALGAIREHDKWNSNCQIRMTIVQPKTGTPIRYQDVTRNELLTIGQDLANKASLTDDDNAPLIADDKNGKGYCTWCKHKTACPALLAKRTGVLKMIPTVTEDGGDVISMLAKSIEKIETLSNKDLSKLLDTEAAISAIFKTVKGEVQKRIDDEQEIPGYGMVPGRKTRAWKDEEEVIVKMLKSKRLTKADIYETKLRSPAQVLACKKLTGEQKDRIEEAFVKEKHKMNLGKIERKKEGLFEISFY